ncbi:exocyst complex component SEC8-like [Telopea speciosissima]|uniref:exocyst complex component SEC8-like n=1 Tax=Telopea speciosissima TaxID=54955 RepID=UPI001CC6A752|nr:exocyst complex component SEC8-like [Telopea speciosissima]
MGIFDGLPTEVADKPYLKEDLSRVDESWAAARFDSLPHVVHILTSKDRESEVHYLKEQSEIVEDVVDEVVHAYHTGFNRAIQNYSQILRLFTESAESIATLKVDLADAKKKLLGSRNKQLHQLWYRSVTLRHIISLLDQIEGIAKVPSRIEKLIVEKQFYAALQLHLQSALMLEREGLQAVGALQDVRSELSKLRGVLFYKVLEDLHSHLYNKGEYSSSFDGESALEMHDRAPIDEYVSSMRATGDDGTLEDLKFVSHQVMPWLAYSTPDEFIEAMKKSDAPVYVKYLQTMVECICMLGKVAASGAMICQRLRPTIHEVITSKIKAHAALVNSLRPCIGQATTLATSGVHYWKRQLKSYQLVKRRPQDEIMLAGTLMAVSPVSPLLAPKGAAHAAAKELLDSILDTVVRILENHVIVGELLESKSAQQSDMGTPRLMHGDINWNPDPEASQATGGYSIGFALTVLQSECQQLICEILRATPEAASADAAVQTARLASKVPSKEKRRDSSEDVLTFAFRFTDAAISISNEGVDLIRKGWNKRGPNVLQEGYGTAAVLPEQGIYLAASIYRPVLQFTDKVASLLPSKYSQLGNDGLLAFVENFLKDHFLPTMFVDYRKGVQQAISSPVAFRPRAHPASTYTPQIERGRPVLQGLLAIDFLAKEVLCWTQAMPKFSGDLVKYVQTFLERTYERCRASYMEAVLEKLSYMLIGRHDVESLMRYDPASVLLPNSSGQQIMENNVSDAETLEVEMEISDVLLSLQPIKQENLIHDDSKLVLLASLSDSLEYVADSIERITQTSMSSSTQVEENHMDKSPHHKHNSSAISRDLASLADEYRKLAIDCLKVLRVEMQLETIFHMQEMTSREYLEDQDAEEPDDFIISLTAQITRRDEEMAPFVAEVKRNYIFGGICGSAANASIKALADMKSINLFGVQQICRNSIALEQALAAIPSIDSESIQLRLDRVRTYYELLNMPFEALLAFITEHEHLFTAAEYSSLIKVKVPGKEIPADAEERLSEILSH